MVAMRQHCSLRASVLTPKTKTIRDRIVDFRRVPARTLIPDSRNWRRHPPSQRDALSGVLREIGFADALLARETDEGLVLIDGHLRADLSPDMDVPVLVLDLDEEEAAKLLLTLDPLAAMAQPDNDALGALLASVMFQDDAINAMLKALPETQPLPQFLPTSEDAQGRLDQKSAVTCPECGHVFTP